MSGDIKNCYFCGKSFEVVAKVGIRDECPECGRDLHACLQCHFYDPNSYNECREPVTEYVSDKEKSNFCGYFVFDPQPKEKSEAAADQARKKLEDLFKK